MKLLEKDELGGIDSTSKTIEKWDEFLKKAVWNLGFSQDTIDKMYPYEKGIPMDDGTYLPVDEVTGRRFFKLSMADKLVGMLATCTSNYSAPSVNYYKIIKTLIITFLANSKQSFLACFNDKTEDDFKEFKSIIEEHNIGLNTNWDSLKQREETKVNLINNYYETFIKQCDIIVIPYIASTSSKPYRYNEEDKNELIALDTSILRGRIVSGSFLIYYNPNLEDVFEPFPRDAFREIARSITEYNSFYNKLKSYDEVYLQDYLCVSLNPIDKLMCSTKQAFSSCMSLAKQNDTFGTSSAPALNLPSLFPTDDVFMVFATPGKHKNMYWEEDEWRKPAEDRDKEKAYKYIKMTCRALTYKGVSNKERIDELDDWMRGSTRLTSKLEELKREAKKEKLFIARQYAAAGEDYVWEYYISYLLHKSGVATSLSFLDTFLELEQLRHEYDEPSQRFGVHSMAVAGTLTQNDSCIVRDRFGLVRSVYLDNITIKNTPFTKSNGNGVYFVEENKPITSAPGNIHIGTCRSGSHGLYSNLNKKENVDAFKLMTGMQDYTYINRYVQICSECGEFLSDQASSSQLADGRTLCEKCQEKLNIKRCPGCGQLYTEDQADEHKLYNINEYIDPEHYKDKPEKLMCYSQLKECSVDDGSGQYLCAHCGTIINGLWRGNIQFALLKIDDLEIKASACDNCLRKAVMCDKCKRVIFLDSISDACLLLPNRRVICPDCIDSIRLKQDAKEMYKKLLSRATVEDFDVPNPAEQITLFDEVCRQMKRKSLRVGSPDTLLKNVFKQIASYVKAHPEKGFPALKVSNPPLPNDEIELPF